MLGGAAASLVLAVILGAAVLLRGGGREPGATPTAAAIAARATDTLVPPTITAPTLVPPTRVPPTLAPPTVPAAIGQRRAMLATVLLIVPLDRERGRSSAGSASVITAKGHLLTNFHVIGDTDTGQLYNRGGVIVVAVSDEPERQPPRPTYRAELVAQDIDLDLALLRIAGREDGRPLGRDLRLTTMPIGNSDQVHIGDNVFIMGFPGLGGDTITLTRGTISGFLTDPGEQWIKTDAEINPGNSGGAAVNDTGELIGVPSAARGGVQRLPGKIGLVRPINLARPLIERAKREAGE